MFLSEINIFGYGSQVRGSGTFVLGRNVMAFSLFLGEGINKTWGLIICSLKLWKNDQWFHWVLLLVDPAKLLFSLLIGY